MIERTESALRSYPTSGRLGEGETGGPAAGAQHVTAEQMQAAVQGIPKVTETPIERTLKVNDKEVKLTLTKSEEDALIQKGLASDEKFREAAELRKEAERARALESDLVQIIKEGDVDAYRRLGAQMGIPGGEVEAAIRQIWGDGSEDEVEEEVLSTQKPSRRAENEGLVPFNRLEPQIQRLILRAEKARVDEVIDNYVDKSDIIGYNMKEYDAAGQKAIRQLVEEKVRGRLAATNGDLGDGSLILPEVIKEVEATLKALGSSRRSVSPLGMGPAPGGGDPGVYPKKKPDHVSSQNSGFEDSIQETIAFHMRNSEAAR